MSSLQDSDRGHVVPAEDLTQAGAGFVSTVPLAPGANVTLRFRVADAKGGAADLELNAVVRNQLPNQSRTRFRIGCRFVGLTTEQTNLIAEYTAVVRPYQLLRA